MAKVRNVRRNVAALLIAAGIVTGLSTAAISTDQTPTRANQADSTWGYFPPTPTLASATTAVDPSTPPASSTEETARSVPVPLDSTWN